MSLDGLPSAQFSTAYKKLSTFPGIFSVFALLNRTSGPPQLTKFRYFDSGTIQGLKSQITNSFVFPRDSLGSPVPVLILEPGLLILYFGHFEGHDAPLLNLEKMLRFATSQFPTESSRELSVRSSKLQSALETLRRF